MRPVAETFPHGVRRLLLRHRLPRLSLPSHWKPRQGWLIDGDWCRLHCISVTDVFSVWFFAKSWGGLILCSLFVSNKYVVTINWQEHFETIRFYSVMKPFFRLCIQTDQSRGMLFTTPVFPTLLASLVSLFILSIYFFISTCSVPFFYLSEPFSFWCMMYFYSPCWY